MGCGGSSEGVTPSFPPEDIRDFLTLGLTYKQMDQINKVYSQVDITQDGSISFHELLQHMKLPKNAMTTKIFERMDGEDNDSKISGREFMLFMWYFLSMTEMDMANFSFEIYDTNGNGILSLDEVKNAVQSLEKKGGAGAPPSKDAQRKVKAMVERMDDNNSKSISRVEYLTHIKQFPALLFPVFEVQSTMRQAVVGEKFWEQIEKQASSIRRSEAAKELFRPYKAKRVPEAEPEEPPQAKKKK